LHGQDKFCLHLSDTESFALHILSNMAKSKQAKAAKKQEETVQQPTPPAQEGSEDGSDVEFVTEAELEKDEAEEELERLVFGDSEGFREGLRDFKLDDDEAEEDGDESDAQDGLRGMDDADVCYSLDMRSFWTTN
jgi:U3 small nucleolar RNA-associated protein 18